MKKRIKTRAPLDWPLSSINPVTTDPQGSYTGVPADPEEKPAQDADDL